MVERTRAQVAAWGPADEEEAEWQRVISVFLASAALPFDRDAGLTHVTASAIVVSRRGVLLHRHRLLGIWLQPGGHIDPGEAPWDAAVREAREETGIEAVHALSALLHLHAGPGGRGHTHLDLRYLLEAPDVDPRPPPGESQDVAWFGWDGALAIADPALVGAIRAARRVIGPPP